jgi:hypothetical protein
MSSGPKTPVGRARIAEVQRKRWAAWRAKKGTSRVGYANCLIER